MGRKGLRKFTKQSVRGGMKREPCWAERLRHSAHLTLGPVRNLQLLSQIQAWMDPLPPVPEVSLRVRPYLAGFLTAPNASVLLGSMHQFAWTHQIGQTSVPSGFQQKYYVRIMLPADPLTSQIFWGSENIHIPFWKSPLSPKARLITDIIWVLTVWRALSHLVYCSPLP